MLKFLQLEIFLLKEFINFIFDVFNKNEDVTIGAMTLYIFNKDCDLIKDNDTSEITIRSNLYL